MTETDLPAGLAKPRAKAATKIQLLSRDDILARLVLPVEVVDVPEWGGKVRVQGLTAAARDQFFTEQSQVDRGGRQVGFNTSNATAKLAARCMVDEEGKPLFSAADVAALGELSAAALGRVAEVAQRLSGMSDNAADDAGKGSGLTLGGGSTSP